MARGGGARGLSATVALWLMSIAGTALAEASPPNPAQAAATVSYGTSVGGSHHPWDVGLGVFGAYALPENIVVGMQVDYFFGGSEPSGANEAFHSTLKVNYFEPMLQAGYDWNFAYHWFLRPGFSAGLAVLRHRVCTFDEITGASGCSHHRAVNAAIAPGLAVVFRHFVMLMWRVRYDVIFAHYELHGLYGASSPTMGVIGTFGIGI